MQKVYKVTLVLFIYKILQKLSRKKNCTHAFSHCMFPFSNIVQIHLMHLYRLFGVAKWFISDEMVELQKRELQQLFCNLVIFFCKNTLSTRFLNVLIRRSQLVFKEQQDVIMDARYRQDS